MNGFIGGGDMKVRVYVYTATNGYSWQGCEDELSESLRTCLGSSWKNPSSGGGAALGGIRRGVVGGLNGTAVYRVHVRKNGDFAGRDSGYVALAFIPFEQVGECFVDYARLWNHDFLASTLGKNEELAGLTIDLSKEGMLSYATARDIRAIGDYWIDEGSPVDGLSGKVPDVLGRLGAAFQSRKTELGSFSALIYDNGQGGICVQSRYRPFPAVKEESAARRDYEKRRRTTGDEAGKAEAYKRWETAVGELVSLTDGRNGQFRHFLGLCQFAREESKALGNGVEQGALRDGVTLSLDCVEKILAAAEFRLTGEEGGLCDALDEVLQSQRPLISQIQESSYLQDRLDKLAERIGTLRNESGLVAQWLAQGDFVLSDSPGGTMSSRRVSASLRTILEKYRGAREEVVEYARRSRECRVNKDKANEGTTSFTCEDGMSGQSHGKTDPQIPSSKDSVRKMPENERIERDRSLARRRFWNKVEYYAPWFGIIVILSLVLIFLLCRLAQELLSRRQDVEPVGDERVIRTGNGAGDANEEAKQTGGSDGKKEEPVPPDVPDDKKEEPIPPDVPDGKKGESVPPDVPDGKKEEAVPPDVPDGKKTEKASPEVPDGKKGEKAPPDVVDGKKGEKAPSEVVDRKKGEKAPPDVVDGKKEEPVPPDVPDGKASENAAKSNNVPDGKKTEETFKSNRGIGGK